MPADIQPPHVQLLKYSKPNAAGHPVSFPRGIERLLLAVTLIFSPAVAFAQDVTTVLAQASRAMGADNLKTIRYTSTGAEYVLGQNATPGGPWPQYNFDWMISAFNYESGTASEELGNRTRADNPPRGGGQPSIGRGITYVTDRFVWTQIGPRSISRPWNVDDRNHQTWITPHGVIKAALRNKATLKWQTRNGQRLAAVSFTEPGKFSATAFIDKKGLVERVESRAAIPFYGELPFVTTYADYEDYAGVKFPSRIRRTQNGFPILDLTVTKVEPNVAVDVRPPDALINAAAYPEPTAVKVADGVWSIPGATNCYAIEMKDYIIVVESPLTNEIATSVFDAARRAIPGKPIRYVVNTHHHIDHSGGLRAAALEGATIITYVSNKRIFEGYFASARRLAPDKLTKSGKKAKLMAVGDKYVFSDGSRNVELHLLRGNRHADDLLMLYLPKEKLLIEADALSPGPPDAPLPAEPDVFSVNLVENIERLKLSVDRILPLHGRIVPLSELYRAVKRSS